MEFRLVPFALLTYRIEQSRLAAGICNFGQENIEQFSSLKVKFGKNSESTDFAVFAALLLQV